jgi:hypothetical protein
LVVSLLDEPVEVHSSGTLRGFVVTVNSSPAYGLHRCLSSVSPESQPFTPQKKKKKLITN